MDAEDAQDQSLELAVFGLENTSIERHGACLGKTQELGYAPKRKTPAAPPFRFSKWRDLRLVVIIVISDFFI
jgi:hypothetical protein